MKKITVTRISDGKIVAGDSGEAITVQSLNDKTSFDITDAAYQVTEIEFDPDMTRENLKRNGEIAMNASQSVMKIINGYGQGLTEQQESDLMTNHGAVFQLLQFNKIWSFKTYIEAIDTAIDSVITAQMKQDILDEISEHGI